VLNNFFYKILVLTFFRVAISKYKSFHKKINVIKTNFVNLAPSYFSLIIVDFINRYILSIISPLLYFYKEHLPNADCCIFLHHIKFYGVIFISHNIINLLILQTSFKMKIQGQADILFLQNKKSPKW